MIKGMYILNAEPVYKINDIGAAFAIVFFILCISLFLWCILCHRIFSNKIILGFCICSFILLLTMIKAPCLQEIKGYEYYCTFDKTVSINEVVKYFEILSYEDGVFTVVERE